MKILILGGYGVYGSKAARCLASTDTINEIAIAGRSIERAAEECEYIGPKAKPVEVDGTDVEKLSRLLRGYDALLNVTFNPVVIPALSAAIGAGVHYFDVSHGDVMWEARDYSDEAKKAGITAIVGIGVQPGLTNLMAARCARQLDAIEQYQFCWTAMFLGNAWQVLTPMQWKNDPDQSLEFVQKFGNNLTWHLKTLQHRSKGANTAVRTFVDDDWVWADPVSEGIDAPAADGGVERVYPYGCSGLFCPGALPFTAGVDRSVQISISPFPKQTNELIRKAAVAVLRGHTDAADAAAGVFAEIKADPRRWLTVPDDFRVPPHLWTATVGTKGGRPARSTSYLMPGTWHAENNIPLTSLPLAMAALCVLDGSVVDRGVFWPEEVLQDELIFRKVAKSLPVSLPNDRLVGDEFIWLDE
jgi:lysine 6-dehydrogenase